jgi:hypothetical protein
MIYRFIVQGIHGDFFIASDESIPAANIHIDDCGTFESSAIDAMRRAPPD